MYVNTPRYPWLSLREAVTADDTAITVFKYSNMPEVGSRPLTGQNLSIDLNSPNMKDANSFLIASWGAGGDNKVITAYRLYGTARMNGPIILLVEGIMTSGAQVCAVHPLTDASLSSNFWVDTITATGGIASGLVDILDSANDRICMLRVPRLNFDRLFMEYDEDSGGMTEWNAMIGGY